MLFIVLRIVRFEREDMEAMFMIRWLGMGMRMGDICFELQQLLCLNGDALCDCDCECVCV